MAKDDEKFDLHPKKAVLNVNSKKIFKTYQRKGIACPTQKALNDLTNKTPPPQTESSSTVNSLPKDIGIDDPWNGFPWNEFDHRICMLDRDLEEDTFDKYDFSVFENGQPNWQLKVPSPKPLPKLDRDAFHRLIPDKLPPPFSFTDDPFRDYPKFQGLPEKYDDHFTSIPHVGADSDDDDSLDEEIDD